MQAEGQSGVAFVAVVPDADAMMINARRTRTDSCLPRRTIRCSLRPSCSVNRRALTGSATAHPTLDSDHIRHRA